VPFAFVLTDNGEGLLGLRSIGDMVWTAALLLYLDPMTIAVGVGPS
jgi:hypothetical protein